MLKRVIRVCGDITSIEDYDPNVITKYIHRENYVCNVKRCKKKKVNGRCSLSSINFHLN